MNAVDMSTFCVLLDVFAERRRQDQLRDAGRFKATLADAHRHRGSEIICILEEIGEVARCCQAIDGLVQEDLGTADLRKELVQVAALAVAWIEGLDVEAAQPFRFEVKGYLDSQTVATATRMRPLGHS